jgi:mRNA interferase HigB
MHLISFKRLQSDAAKFPDVSRQTKDWYDVVKTVDWQNLEEVRETFCDAEAVGNFTVFNIKGNAYRLIVSIDYEDGTIYYKYFLTHADYDKDKWKNDPYF